MGARAVRMRNMEPTGSTLRKSPGAGLKSIAKLHLMRRKLQGRGERRARETLSFAKINRTWSAKVICLASDFSLVIIYPQ